MKIPGQKHTALMQMMKWRLPPYLQSDLAIVDAINRFDDKLARLLLPYANSIAQRRDYSGPFADAVHPVTVDADVGPSKFDEPIWLEDDDEDDEGNVLTSTTQGASHSGLVARPSHAPMLRTSTDRRTPAASTLRTTPLRPTGTPASRLSSSEGMSTPSSESTVSMSDGERLFSPVIQTHASSKDRGKNTGENVSAKVHVGT